MIDNPVITKEYDLSVVTKLARHHKFVRQVSVLNTLERVLQMYPRYRKEEYRARLLNQLNKIYQEAVK